MTMIIAGKDCEPCIYGLVKDKDIAKVKVHCKCKDKEYYWGTCIPCEVREVKKQNENK